MRKWVIVLVILGVASGLAYYFLKPKADGALDISRSVLGSEMKITSARFDSQGNSLRLLGHWEGNPPPDQYLVRATVSDTPDGPASSGMFGYYGTGSGQPGFGARFSLEFESLPASARQLYAHIYFADKRNSFSLAAGTAFDLSNAPTPQPKGFTAVPLPQVKESDSLAVTLVELKTGRNFAPDGRTPQWFTSATFSVTDAAGPADLWRLMELEIVPNIGAPIIRTQAIPKTRDGVVIAPITGTLWEADGPYQVRASFYRIDESSRDQLAIFTGVTIPGGGAVTPLDQTWTVGGVNVGFLGIYGRGSKLPKGFRESTAGTSTFVFTVDSREDAWIKLSTVTIAGAVRKVDELRRIRKGADVFSITLGDFLPGQTIGLELALLTDRREFSFVAEPTRPD